MCYVLINMIFVFLFFLPFTLMTSVCLVLLWSWSCVSVRTAVFLFVTCVCVHDVSFFLSICVFVCVCVYMSMYCPIPPPNPPTRSPTTRVPGGECRQWGCSGGRGYPRDQCDRRERWANAQRRLPKATHWWSHPARQRHVGHHVRGQHGPPRSWLQHEGSGGQEAEVCEANGGEWGFWIGLHREEPVLRSCPSLPLLRSRGNLGNRVWGGVVWKAAWWLPPLPFFALGSTTLSSPNCTIPLICLSDVIHSFTLLCG